MKQFLFTLFSGLMIALSTAVQAGPMTEIVIEAELRDKPLLDLSNSVSVFNEDTLQTLSATHLEQVLNLAPNVNFSAGASRGRFIQIRGIGERSQFVDPVNSSVGLIIDGIDFTGLGLAASTLDIRQVEILRGPQGTLYGANALAGLVNLASNTPDESFSASFGADISEYDGRMMEAVVSGPLSEATGYRLAVRSNRSDGHYLNRFLDSESTNNINEEFARGTLAFEINDAVSGDLKLFYINADNGYDAFSLSNNRITGSDQPGRDKQESMAGAITLNWVTDSAFDIALLLSAADTDSTYEYDEDWSFIGEFAAGLFPYSSADSYDRERETHTLDIRLSSKADNTIFNDSSSWVFGFYHRSDEEQLIRNRFDDLALVVDPNFPFDSSYETENTAVYGQIETKLSENWTLVSGLRVEHREADYEDSNNIEEDVSDTSTGGRIALEYRASEQALVYALVSRGFKAGGVNGQILSSTNINVQPANFFFDEESQWNYEVGVKGNWLDNALQMQLALFHQNRTKVQAKQSIFNPADFSFEDFLTNADGSSNGLELELNYAASENVDLFASLGLLNAEFEGFISNSHVDARNDALGIPLESVSLDGRDIAHAPNHQFALGGEYRFNQRWYLHTMVEGKDEFYFSNSHNEKSENYEMVHARLGYRSDDWELAVWGKNLTDEDVEVRGFYFSNEFGNNPDNGYAPELYTQLGEPRTMGVSLRFHYR